MIYFFYPVSLGARQPGSALYWTNKTYWRNQLDEIEVQDLREHYFKISNHIYDQDLDIYEIGVYSCLCRFANNETTESFPSITKIQKMLKIGRTKTINAIKKLVDKKIVYKKMGKTGFSNRYYLLNIPSPRGELVRQINQGSPGGEPPSPHGVRGVVREVNPKKTYIKKTNKKDLGKKPLFDEFNKCIRIAEKGGEGYHLLKETTKNALIVAGGLTQLKGADSFARNSMKYEFVDALEKQLESEA